MTHQYRRLEGIFLFSTSKCKQENKTEASYTVIGGLPAGMDM